MMPDERCLRQDARQVSHSNSDGGPGIGVIPSRN
jgi:hypothetical protein